MSSENYNMLCSYHGSPLLSRSEIGSVYLGGGDSGRGSTAGVSSIDELKNKVNAIQTNTTVFPMKKTYHTYETATYKLKGPITCNPKKAYILNNMNPGANSYGAPGSYTNIQKAWYKLIGFKYSSQIYDEASAYQQFVKKIATNVNNTNSYVTMKHTYSDGSTATIDFPKINTEKISSMFTFNTVDENNNVEDSKNKWATNVTVNYDQENQKYMIGPFSIKYIESNCNGVNFGSIDGFDIYTDASSQPLNNNQWRFVWQKDQREDNDTFAYPHSKEIFYIEMDYIENATMITGIDVNYKYLVAGAEYYDVTSKGSDVITWNVESNGATVIKHDEGEDEKKYNWKLVQDNTKGTQASQKLALASKAARWYETAKISLRANQGTLEIEKKALDENGNEMTADQIKEKFGEYQYFDFRIKMKHSTGEVETNDVTVRAGTSLITGPYSWADDEDVPTFEVEEIPSSDERWELVSVEPSTGTLKQGQKVTVIATNKITAPKSNKISINKTISGEADEDEEFKFKVTITDPNTGKVIGENTATVTVPKGKTTGETWVSDSYEWYGDTNPTFEIEELETEASKKYNSYINPSKGELDGTGAKIKVDVLNNENGKKGSLTIDKVLKDGQITDETFNFHVKVDKVKGGPVEFDVTGVKPGEQRGPFEYVWDNTTCPEGESPTYEITETNADGKHVKITAKNDDTANASDNKITGHLTAGTQTDITTDTPNNQVNVEFQNDLAEHKGKIEVVKDIKTLEKISKETLEKDGIKFEIEVAIAGTFKYKDKTIENGTEVITVNLPKDGKWNYVTDDIIWYGTKAPTFTITEKNLPTGWRLHTIEYSNVANNEVSTEGRSLIEGTITATVTNELPEDTTIDLTFEMGGLVWVDQDKADKNKDEYYSQSSNGVYDKDWDLLKENAEVTVYRAIYDKSGNEVSGTRSIATAYKDENNNELQFPIITKSDGKWNVPRISVPAFTASEKEKGYSSAKGYYVAYDAQFAYDGQTYEPVEFLAYKVSGDEHEKVSGSNAERAKAYKEGTKSQKKKYFKDSMAVETSNNSKLITEVSGKTAMDANGDTTGFVTVDGKQHEITYHSDNAGSGYPAISKVNTTGSDGRVFDIFKATASTSAGNLSYPFAINEYDQDDYDKLGLSIATKDKTIDEMPLAEFSKTTDKNGVHKKYKYVAVYNYCKNINLGLKERSTVDVGLTKHLDNAKVVVKEKMYEYKYSGNYDLTEEKQNTLAKEICSASSQAISTHYTLGLYKTDYYYRAEIYNASEDKKVYDALADFYKDLNKTINDTEMDIYLTYKITLANNSSKYDVVINSLDDYYESNLTLVKEAETKYLKTQTVGGKETDVNDTITVANASDYKDKWNLVKTGIAGSDNVTYNKMIANELGIKLEPNTTKEITMTFKVNKEDNDTAKNAIVLGQKCNVAEIGSYWAYDTGTTTNAGRIDRDSAPSNVNISASNAKNWYEDDTFAAPRIQVKLTDGGDRTIEGTAWEDNSKDKNTENPGYNQQVGNGKMDNDEKGIENLTTELVEKVKVQNKDGKYTEYDFIWPTDQKLGDLNNQTLEEISGFESTIKTGSEGKYTFTNAPSGDYAVRFTYGDTEIQSQDYSDSQYYNGQDYKSSKFASALKGDKLQADSYLDIDKLTEKANTAIDNEVRRLDVVAKSREITFENNKVLAAANIDNYRENMGTLLEEYQMYAETPKIDMNIERMNYDSGKDSEKTYNVTEVNFGLEERPTTKLSLDKQIEEIMITTSDGRNIMDAKYDINYKVDDNGKVIADVKLNENSYGTDNLQALNRDLATNNGFRYVNVDFSILQGTTITVKYRFTVLNTGEVDRTGKLAEFDYTDKGNESLKNATNSLSESFATQYSKDGNTLKNNIPLGQYVGSIYYYGEDKQVSDESDAVVTSMVRQLVDYIDNDVTFSGTMNATKDMSWSNVTTEELTKLVDSNIKDNETGKIVDSNGVQYETENRSNLAVSVDTYNTDSSLNNEGLIVALVPYEANKDNSQAAMNLTVVQRIGADSDDLQIDNIAEIIKYNNSVGRRDELSVVGNVNPKEITLDKKDLIKSSSEYGISEGFEIVYERDTSASEVITLSPPTGSGLSTWRLQVLATTIAGLAIIAGGIVLIKKKILK